MVRWTSRGQRVAANGRGVKGRFAKRDRDDERAAATELGLDPRFAAVALRDVLDERETDSTSSHLVLGHQRAADETLEDAAALAGRNAGTLVAHPDLERIS